MKIIKSSHIVLGILLIVVIGGGFLLFGSNKDSTTGQNQSLAIENNKSSVEIQQEKVDANSNESTLAVRYTDYSEQNYAVSRTFGKTLLFFAATTWCSNCKVLDGEIRKRNAELPKDITILKVDYDRNSALKTKYGVTMQTTLILLDKNGNEEKRWIGSDFDNLLTSIN